MSTAGQGRRKPRLPAKLRAAFDDPAASDTDGEASLTGVTGLGYAEPGALPLLLAPQPMEGETSRGLAGSALLGGLGLMGCSEAPATPVRAMQGLQVLFEECFGSCWAWGS